MTRRKVVFIMSLGHSGSTILHLVLASHSRAFGLGEFASARRRLRADAANSSLCGICVGACPFWDGRADRDVLKRYFGGQERSWLRKQVEARFGSFKADIYGALFAWLGPQKGLLVDSSKSPGWIKRQVRPPWHWRDIDPYLLYLTRDGRAVVNSLMRKNPETSIEKTSRAWLNGVLSREKMFQRFSRDRRAHVSYERFALEPEGELKRLCDWLELPFEAGMSNYWTQEHHPVAGNLGAYVSLLVQQANETPELLEHYRASNQVERLTDLEYYESIGPAIRADFRWKRELSAKDLLKFRTIVGEANAPYVFELDEA